MPERGGGRGREDVKQVVCVSSIEICTLHTFFLISTTKMCMTWNVYSAHFSVLMDQQSIVYDISAPI